MNRGIAPSGDELILCAARTARGAHALQRRKYGGRPYIEHPARVAAQVMLLDDVTAAAVAAAWLHDVLEDCGWSDDDLREAGFSEETVSIVVELTNVSKQHTHLNRAQRKQMDRERLSTVSQTAKRIKMVDRLDNLRDVREADEDFRSLYVAESILLIQCIGDADQELAERVYTSIEELGFARDHRHPKAEPPH